MNLSIRNFVLTLGLLLLAACGGDGFTPSGDLSKAQAMALVSQSGRSKIPADALNRLLNQSSNDVLVEFVMIFKPGDPPAPLLAEFLAQRDKVTQSFSPSEYSILQSFDSVQSVFARVQTRRALVKLLNHADVRLVHENAPNFPN